MGSLLAVGPKRFFGMGRMLLLAALLYGGPTAAAVQPADGAVLTQTQVLFAWDEVPGADGYTFTLRHADGRVLVVPVSSLAYLLSGQLAFGQRYQWNVQAYQKKKRLYQSPAYAFSIAASPLVDPARFRYTVKQKKGAAHSNGLVFMDHLGVAVNRNGEPVWYLPFDSAAFGEVPKYRNLQLTPSGTVTFLRGSGAYEKSLSGQPVWEAPNTGAVSLAPTEFYHHDFIKNAAGQYMVCSYRYVEMPSPQQPTATIRVRYNTVVTYDVAGNVVWQWNEQDHSDLNEMLAGAPPGATEIPGTHMNGFSCNDQTGTCVFSFRNNSALWWIDRATGKVLYRLQGEKPGGIAFAAQHSPVYLPNGDVLFYNNNVPNGKGGDDAAVRWPTVLQLRMNKGRTGVQKVWEYECRLPQYPNGWAGKEGFADLLPNGNILVCIGGGNTVLEVDHGKRVVWQMETEAFDAAKNSWVPFSNYRTHVASSLYPQFFTVQQTGGQGPVRVGGSIRIKLNNDGSDAGAYRVELFSNGYFAPHAQTLRLAPGAAAPIAVALKKGPGPVVPGELPLALIRVTPLGQGGAAKELVYRIGDR
jgi:hypothetical protein